MIPAPIQVWLVVEAIDMRAGIDGLSQRIQNALGRSPCDGSAYALPQLHAMHDWLLQTRVTVANGGGTAKAIDYSLKRWAALSRYATDGRLPIDNNPVENVIRPIALGRKNWLFTGSEQAGQRAAAIQSLLATAKLNGLDPAAWLRDTLEKLPTCLNSQIDSLLPLRAKPVPQVAT